MPSVEIFVPGFMINMSPILRSSIGIWSSFPPLMTVAVFGWSPMSFLIASDALPFVRASKYFPSRIKTIIIGHEHPAVVITDGVKREKYKCFLRGTYKKKELIVLPSFNFVSMGTDVLHGKLLSPLLTNIEKFEVFAVEDKIYPMGKVKDLI